MHGMELACKAVIAPKNIDKNFDEGGNMIMFCVFLKLNY